jgi:hypothetical protein
MALDPLSEEAVFITVPSQLMAGLTSPRDFDNNLFLSGSPPFASGPCTQIAFFFFFLNLPFGALFCIIEKQHKSALAVE